MNASIQAVRAISWVIIERVVRVWTIIAVFTAFISVALEIWLMQLSTWWGLAWLVLLPLFMVTTMLLGALWFGLSRLTPRKLSKAERTDIKSVAEKTTSIIETARTPYPFLLIRLAFDVIRGRDSTLIERTLSQTAELKSDFARIRCYFET